MTSASQDDLNLYLLNELERLNLLVKRLQERGVVHETDVALSNLQSALKQEERRLSLVTGDDQRKSQAVIKRLAEQIEALTV